MAVVPREQQADRLQTLVRLPLTPPHKGDRRRDGEEDACEEDSAEEESAGEEEGRQDGHDERSKGGTRSGSGRAEERKRLDGKVFHRF